MNLSSPLLRAGRFLSPFDIAHINMFRSPEKFRIRELANNEPIQVPKPQKKNFTLIQEMASPNRISLAFRLAGHNRITKESLECIVAGIFEGLEKHTESEFKLDTKRSISHIVSNHRKSYLEELFFNLISRRILIQFDDAQIDEMLDDFESYGSIRNTTYENSIKSIHSVHKNNIINSVAKAATEMSEDMVPEVVEHLIFNSLTGLVRDDVCPWLVRLPACPPTCDDQWLEDVSDGHFITCHSQKGDSFNHTFRVVGTNDLSLSKVARNTLNHKIISLKKTIELCKAEGNRTDEIMKCEQELTKCNQTALLRLFPWDAELSNSKFSNSRMSIMA